ncbi:Hypothetical predicted protein [Marmota monax]|uniref:Uncharacterized protein n=1 Tax=Marmota monax TaxID=9995 RepID=A0A5E4AT40_MARMO|nr:Hypothetical predicted protein [Marmota monax]
MRSKLGPPLRHGASHFAFALNVQRRFPGAVGSHVLRACGESRGPQEAVGRACAAPQRGLSLTSRHPARGFPARIKPKRLSARLGLLSGPGFRPGLGSSLPLRHDTRACQEKGKAAVRRRVFREGPAGRRRGGRCVQDSRGAHRAGEAAAAGAGVVQADQPRVAVPGHGGLPGADPPRAGCVGRPASGEPRRGAGGGGGGAGGRPARLVLGLAEVGRPCCRGEAHTPVPGGPASTGHAVGHSGCAVTSA